MDMTLEVFSYDLTVVKRVGNLHNLLFYVHHLKRWRLYSPSFVSEFMTKTQYSSVLDTRLEGSNISSLHDLVGDDKDQIFLCLVHAANAILYDAAFTLACQHFFGSTGWIKEVGKNTICK